MFNDAFLGALGAWQKGWSEDSAKRLAITSELQEAIDGLSSALPKRSPPPSCYRKRFIRPHNPQNPDEMSKFLLVGELDDGVASWTTDVRYGRQFKELLRVDHFTVLFKHQPCEAEVVVDIPALWADEDFIAAVDDYSSRDGKNADALLHFRSSQSEIILTALLKLDEVVGLVGQVGPYDDLFALAQASSEHEQDVLIEQLFANDLLPGKAKWTSGEGAQRALKRTRKIFMARVNWIVRCKQKKSELRASASLVTLESGLAGQFL